MTPLERGPHGRLFRLPLRLSPADELTRPPLRRRQRRRLVPSALAQRQRRFPRFWHDHVVRALGVAQGEDAIGYVCMFRNLAEEGRAPPETIADVTDALALMS